MFKRLFLSHAARRRTSWFIAAVLILPFVFFFHASLRSSVKGPGGSAGTLFGKPVSWDTFEEQRRWTRTQLQGRLSGAPEPVLEPLINQYAWQRLMLVEEARRRGLRVDDLELAAFIHRLPEFQKGGRFLPERYHLSLRAVGLPAATFEERLRNDLLIEKLVASVRAAVAVTDADLRAAFVRAHEQLRASLILLESAAFVEEAAAALTEEDVRARYEARPDEIRRPEQVAFEYAGLSRESLAGAISPTDDDLKSRYEAHQEEFAGEDGKPKPLEQVRDAVRQALITERVRKQLTERALDLQEDLEAKRAFDEIVAERGLTKEAAGPLAVGEPPPPGGPDPAILQAVSGLDQGKMTEVVQTMNGVYIARLTQRIPPAVPPLAEVRDAVRQRLIRERAREAARQRAETLRAKLQERMASGLRFEEAVLTEQLSTTPVQFTRLQAVGPLGYERRLNETAFATPLGQLTPVLEAARGFAFLRPEERVAPDESAFAQEAPGLRQETLSRRQEERFGEWMQEVRQRAKLKSFVDKIADER